MPKSEGVRYPSRQRSPGRRITRRLKLIERRLNRIAAALHLTLSSRQGHKAVLVTLVFCLLTCGLTIAAGVPERKKPIFQPQEFPRGWVFHSAVKKSKLIQTWKIRKAEKVEDSVLICTGKPLGYIRTAEWYDNFELSMQWKYPKDANGNSGVLVYTSGDDRIWPRSIQVQLHGPVAGSIFPVGGALTDNKLDSKDLKLRVDTWHSCLIVCKDGTVTVSINGEKLGTVTGCNPVKGCIALQSEGSEVHFRRIKLKQLK